MYFRWLVAIFFWAWAIQYAAQDIPDPIASIISALDGMSARIR